MDKCYLLHDSIQMKGDNVLRLCDIEFPKLFCDLPFKELECVEFFYIKGVLEICSNIRHILRSIDYSVKVNGIVDIKFFHDRFDSGGGFYRSYSYIMYELGLVFGSRYTLLDILSINNQTHLKYIKNISFFANNDNVDSWSFGLVTSGRDEEIILKNVDIIRRFNVPHFEILVCCSGKITENGFRLLDDSHLSNGRRIPIAAKKNLIAKEARYNNLIIFHDRIIFPENWFREISRLKSAFDVVCFPILDIETRSHRLNDWIKLGWDLDYYQKSIGRLMPYSSWSPEVYINGGVICIKRSIYLDVLQNSNLQWGEMEDVDFSRRLMLNGANIVFYPKANVLSTTKRFGRLVDKSFLVKLKEIIFEPYSKFRNKQIFDKQFKDFLKS